MADIGRYPFARHLRGGRDDCTCGTCAAGKLVHDGTGLSFWFRPLSAVLSEVPVDDRELPLLFHARTADFQDLAVQASVTFRVTDPAIACARIDFSLDPDTGRWRGDAAGAGRRAAHRDRAAAGTRPDRRQPAGQRAGGRRRRRSGTGSWPGSTADPRLGRDRDRGHRRPRRSRSGPSRTWRRRCRPRPASRCSRRRTGPPTSGGPWPSSGSGPSPRTSCRARSSWPAARSSWSTSGATNARRQAEEDAAAERHRGRGPGRPRAAAGRGQGRGHPRARRGRGGRRGRPGGRLP